VGEAITQIKTKVFLWMLLTHAPVRLLNFLLNEGNMKERYYSLQILRAVAAWIVFYHHYMQLFYDFKYTSIIGKFFSIYGSFGVDIFFVLSGFVMYFSAINSSVNAPSFFIKRFFRVVPI